jgi:hypothetical protein
MCDYYKYKYREIYIKTERPNFSQTISISLAQ